MDTPSISRRELLIQGTSGLVLLHAPWFVQAFPSRPGEEVVAVAGSAGRQPERRRRRELAAVGKPRFFLYHAQRQVLPRVALRQAGDRRQEMEPRDRRAGEEADER